MHKSKGGQADWEAGHRDPSIEQGVEYQSGESMATSPTWLFPNDVVAE